MTQLLEYHTEWTAEHQSGDFEAESITIHWWGDPDHYRQGSVGEFNRVCDYLSSDNDRESSAHLVVSGPVGRFACLVDLEHAAWHAGVWAGNHRSVGVECWPWDENTPPEQVEEQLLATAYVVALLWHWKPKLKGVALKGHRDWRATACPGSYYAVLDDIERRAKALYPRVDPDRPGFLTGDGFDMASLDDLREIVEEHSLRGDVVPRPKYSKPDPNNPKDVKNTTWRGDNVLSYIIDMVHEARGLSAEALAHAVNADKNSAATLEIVKEMAKRPGPLTEDQIEDAARRGLESIITGAETVLHVDPVTGV